MSYQKISSNLTIQVKLMPKSSLTQAVATKTTEALKDMSADDCKAVLGQLRATAELMDAVKKLICTPFNRMHDANRAILARWYMDKRPEDALTLVLRHCVQDYTLQMQSRGHQPAEYTEHRIDMSKSNVFTTKRYINKLVHVLMTVK